MAATCPQTSHQTQAKKQVLVTLKYQLLFDDAQNFGWNCTLLRRIYGRLTTVCRKMSIHVYPGGHFVEFLFVQFSSFLFSQNILHYRNAYMYRIIVSLQGEPRRNQAPVVEKLGSAIHRINHYPMHKCQGNLSGYPVDRDLSGG